MQLSSAGSEVPRGASRCLEVPCLAAGELTPKYGHVRKELEVVMLALRKHGRDVPKLLSFSIRATQSHTHTQTQVSVKNRKGLSNMCGSKRSKLTARYRASSTR